MVRTHVVLPRSMVEEIDRLVGQRKRSEYITEVLRERLIHERQRQTLHTHAGVLDLADHPEWNTPEKTSEWVRDLRREAEERTAQKWERRGDA
jgi:metal-responsive CopG/Arc/MetJ family transcriptional regulator